MVVDDKLVERRILLKRSFPRLELYEIGKTINIPYFNQFSSGWEINEDEATLEIASNIGNSEFKKLFKKYTPRFWTIFRGKYYTFEGGVLRMAGSWDAIRMNIHQTKKKHGKKCVNVLKLLAETSESCGIIDIKRRLKRSVDPLPILEDLERLKVIVTSYIGDNYKEWKILEEVLPLIRSELGMISAPSQIALPTMPSAPPSKKEKVDHILMEQQTIQNMENELDEYLNDLIKSRLNTTTRFGRLFSTNSLAKHLQDLFGPILYFDSLLSIVQQYGLANVEIAHPQGKTGKRTGWSLALFGEPGTGKSFATRDMISGNPDAKVPAHGIPGRNRYCGGITPARFIRIGQAYANRTFNFIVPEFNDWFRYSGMVDLLKLAMERGEIKYELHREVIGPYRFESFLSVNYNTTVSSKGYTVTVSDPNFNAIEDRMVCRLHHLTKQRFVEIAQSQMKLALGEIDVEKGAKSVQDHLVLVYAIETRHPLVRGKFPYKPVMITPKTYEIIRKAREAILEQIPKEDVKFSARLEDRAIRFACAASLIDYFHAEQDCIAVGKEALWYAVKLYVEEASARSSEEFNPEEILEELSKTIF